jgi:hypothetical protein
MGVNLMKIPSHEELQRMSEEEIADLNFYFTIKKVQRLSILMVLGGVVMYGVGYLIEQYFTDQGDNDGEQ